MSRGIGQLQQRILATLEVWQCVVTVPDLTESIFGEAFTRANLVSVRRAVLSLARRGLVLSACASLHPHWVRRVWLPSHPRAAELLTGPTLENESATALAREAGVSRSTIARTMRLQREDPAGFEAVLRSARLSVARGTK